MTVYQTWPGEISLDGEEIRLNTTYILGNKIEHDIYTVTKLERAALA